MKEGSNAGIIEEIHLFQSKKGKKIESLEFMWHQSDRVNTRISHYDWDPRFRSFESNSSSSNLASYIYFSSIENRKDKKKKKSDCTKHL